MFHLIKASAWGQKFGFYERDGKTPLSLSHKKVSVLVKKFKEDSDENLVLPRKDFENLTVNWIAPLWTAKETKNIPVGDYCLGIKIYRQDGLDKEVFYDVLRVNKGIANA